MTTNIGHYADWILRTVQYLDTSYTDTVTDKVEQVNAVDRVEDTNPCSAQPCGENALCWNGEGTSYLCTCMSQYPHGNPYNGCAVCQYDNHCDQGEQCQAGQCVDTGLSSGGEAAYRAPPEYVSVGGEQYYVSTKPSSWSQAQYDCMNREGMQH